MRAPPETRILPGVLHELRDATPACGGKARQLARLIAAELDVPAGFAIDDAAFRAAAGELPADLAMLGHDLAAIATRVETAAIPAALEAEVIARATALGGRLAVRSSATIEDGEAGAAAGVFSSRTAVEPARVWDAIRAVWASALTPLAATYARRRGGAVAIGVVVQRFVDGERVTVYTRPPGHAERDEVVIQRGEQVARVPRDADDEVVRIALAAEQAIGATGGADVELVVDRDAHVWVVQARPIVHPVAVVRVPPPEIVLAPLRDGRVWTWDVAHNPEPLSLAQQGLVERAAAVSRYELRVCGGYLYATPRELPPIEAPRDVDALDALASRLEGEMAAALGDGGGLAEAIERYVAFYRPWSELGAVIAAVRATLAPAAWSTVGRGGRASAVEWTLMRAASGELAEDAAIGELGVMAPAWDVAVPTYAERPGLVRDAIARVRAAGFPASSRAPTASEALELARRVADLAERDDAWFAQAQWMVRRAVLEAGRVCGIDGEDAFWVPLDELVAAQLARVGASRDESPRRVDAHAPSARAAAERAGRWEMPIVVGSPAVAGISLRGIGTGPRVTGRVVRFASLASAIAVGRGDVIVTRAVTPALAVFIAGCAALISETGGLLDHGASLARELGVTCVVGCTDAWRQLLDGTTVIVDGDAGTVTPL